MKAVCLKKNCDFRILTESGIYYCPFGKCPFNMSKEIENDRKATEQSLLHREKNNKA